jgi:hypothetical protein
MPTMIDKTTAPMAKTATLTSPSSAVVDVTSIAALAVVTATDAKAIEAYLATFLKVRNINYLSGSPLEIDRTRALMPQAAAHTARIEAPTVLPSASVNLKGDAVDCSNSVFE